MNCADNAPFPAVPMRQIRLDLAYDGTDFAGWQIQPRQRTVEGMLKDAIEQVVKHPVTARPAGRTDAGVHAAHQVVSFQTGLYLTPRQFQLGINSLLPPDIRIWNVSEEPADWDVRRAAARTYRYRILDGLTHDPLRRRFVVHLRTRLDIGAMDTAIRTLEGLHDFNAFRSSQCDAPHAIRRMFSARVEQVEDEIVVVLSGWAFLRHMVRIIVGTLFQIGMGKRPVEDMAHILAGKDRTQAGPTAPPHGLVLQRVDYQLPPEWADEPPAVLPSD